MEYQTRTLPGILAEDGLTVRLNKSTGLPPGDVTVTISKVTDEVRLNPSVLDLLKKWIDEDNEAKAPGLTREQLADDFLKQRQVEISQEEKIDGIGIRPRRMPK